MKSYILIIASLVLFAGICFGQHNTGDKAVMFTAQHFFTDIGVSGINEGIGAKYFLFKGIALKGSYGSTLSNVATPITSISGAIGLDLGTTKNTAVSVAPTLTYSHSNGIDVYSFGGGIEAEVFFIDNVSLAGNYLIAVSHESATNTTEWRIGGTSGSVNLSVYF